MGWQNMHAISGIFVDGLRISSIKNKFPSAPIINILSVSYPHERVNCIQYATLLWNNIFLTLAMEHNSPQNTSKTLIAFNSTKSSTFCTQLKILQLKIKRCKHNPVYLALCAGLLALFQHQIYNNWAFIGKVMDIGIMGITLLIYFLTGGNWQKWKRVFLTCPCHEIYRDEAVGLKSCKNTWKITIFVKMWNLGQYRENLIFCQ